ncbi:hypothetical protein [Shewanella dokdonensis]|uniref:Lipoprotein SmpA/OmlA domain-containing protein n=1 Tax=Shewanella dokdonensis TaxID=712036 RepID=A0ABX8DIR7_9GAMM|nr:hypothetical protein [Shewanella dokdonensis]MCL1075910.1 hypothetical protein [Shewanella dokdonensis]QVK24230.1 hypothetical protein KHX94_06635 [Shewanella dokdonensis]
MNRNIIFAVAALILTSCATSHMTTGADFDATKVTSIVKGKTSADELQILMGQPFTKTVIDENSERWGYLYTDVTSKAKSYVFSVDVNTTGLRKQLDVLIKDGVVVNYSYTEAPIGSQLKTN